MTPAHCATVAERHGLPPGFHRLITAQFASAWADHALLIVTMALLDQQGRAGWWAPLLKVGFTLCYVLFAPFVGALADAVPKARTMAAMNGVKLLGLLALLVGAHPLVAFTVIGFGAAAFAPAKYGLITELVPAHLLVRANAWIEVSVVGAALLGTVGGGALVSQTLLAHIGDHVDPAWWPVRSMGALSLPLVLLLAVYAGAAIASLSLPDSGARYPTAARHPAALVRQFQQAQHTLWRDAVGGLSLATTTLFWGVGAVMQFIVLRWATDVRGLPLSQAAAMQGLVAVGAIAGATWAARAVPLNHAARTLPAGVLLGLLLPLLAVTEHDALAWALLALAGAVGGVLVVPMNALLQHRGCTLLSAGQSIAVQGFAENLSVLALLALYALCLHLAIDIQTLMSVLGLAVAAGTAWLARSIRLPRSP